MTHCNTVVDGDGIELSRIAAQLLYLCFYDLSYLVQMSMTRNELGKAVYDSDDGFAELLSLHAVSNPKSTCSSHTTAFCADSAS